ncbi:hypothetical protein N7455_007498 [Penicillium solitum]|uniref:uncharacterized protein n=1 Tax=Penicillium solitum TaxID=60172 RepID=UPI0032C45D31|nr:hypothetical protein N7455_007498 [Penicillium solitum]
MKLLHSLCFLSVASAAALSVPVADIPSDTNLVPGELVGYGADEVEIRTPNEANVLEARASPTCRRIGRVISRYGTSSAVVATLHLTTGLAKDFCEGENSPKCARYVGYVQSGLDIIFLVIGITHGAVGTYSTAEDSHFDPGPVRRGLPTETFSADALRAALKNDGWIYDHLEQVDVSSLNLEKRDSDPRMTQRMIARNVTLNDQDSASDIAFNYFDNGDLNLHFPGDSGTFPAGNAQDSPLHKRFDGTGFKISATTRAKTNLPRDQQKAMAHEIATNWAFDAYDAPMSDYMGLVKTGRVATPTSTTVSFLRSGALV